ncbi:MAG TPA: hypothetical protein VGK57_07570, partial [Candidatus Binatia bacterium]
PKDHRLCEKGKGKRRNSFHRKCLCFLTCLLMGNPNGWMTENLYGQPSGGLFGYSHMLGARREQATTLPETERYMIQSRQHGHAK